MHNLHTTHTRNQISYQKRTIDPNEKREKNNNNNNK